MIGSQTGKDSNLSTQKNLAVGKCGVKTRNKNKMNARESLEFLQKKNPLGFYFPFSFFDRLRGLRGFSTSNR